MRTFTRGSLALTGAGLLGLVVPALQAAEQKSEDLAEVVVTGSRIAGSVGMTTPTPVTAVTAEELNVLSPSTLISALSQLPQFYGNTNSDTRMAFFSNPGEGNLNLRGLNTGGSGRTLTLLDSRRVVPANGFGSVDINILPSALIKRVDTVTGGASAAYGTDAVAGAVNFILDTGYDGWQVNAQGGITGEGDRGNGLVSAAFGTDIGDRAHLLVSAEYYHANQIENLYSRDWYQGYSLFNNPDTAASALRYLSGPDVVSSFSTIGGSIVSCPATPCSSSAGVLPTSALWRRHFNPDGTLSPFVAGVGTYAGAQSIANGGTGDDLTGDLQALSPEAQRASAFVYFDVDATPNLNLFVQGLAGQSMADQPDNGGRFNAVSGIDTRLTIFRDNAFLPAAVRQIMVNENLQSFQMNFTGDRTGLGRDSHVRQDNKTYAGTGGFRYTFNTDGYFNGWTVDGYAQYGTADNKGTQEGIVLNRMIAAIDAIPDPSNPSRVICRAATLNASKWGDCVPLNLFGQGNASDAAIAYVTKFTTGQQISSPLYFQPDAYESGETVSYTSGPGKVYNTETKQTVAELSTSGKLFEGWAGPVATALGITWRREEINQIVYDPSNPASDPNVFPAVDTALRGVPSNISTRSSMIQNSTVPNVHGWYEVKEAFAELQVPLLVDVPAFKEVNLLAAARYADYTGSGGVWSWKGGLNWQVFDDLRLRGTISQDVRAATLLERFNQTGGIGSVTRDPAFPTTAGPFAFTSRTGGNPNLDPETSNTFTYGLVYQPGWLQGFSVSVDYWDVDIDDAIGTLGFQAIVDGCYAGAANLCELVTRDPVTNRLSGVKNISVNIAAAAGRGLDTELDYRRPIDLFGEGNEIIGVRLFWSHLIENSTTSNRSLPATYPNYVDRAGQTGVGVLPEEAITASLTYTVGGLNLSASARYISDGVYNVAFNLPGAKPDVADNTVPSVVYVNLGAGYNFEMAGGTLEVYADVQNLLDKDPPITPAVFDTALAQTGSQYNAGLFDLLGRRYTLGVRFKH